jgi:L-2,4-diaminobutyrate decarboxylase
MPNQENGMWGFLKRNISMKKKILSKGYEAAAFRKLGHEIIDYLADYLDQANSSEGIPANRQFDPDVLYDEMKQMPFKGKSLELFQKVVDESVHLHSRKYMGHQISPTLPVAALAGLVSDFINNGMGVFEMGTLGTAMEKSVVQTMTKYFGLGQDADGFLTSGGTLSNFTALLTARAIKANELIWENGQTQKLGLMVSEQAHYCVDRAVRMMGWGAEGIIKVPTNDRFQIEVDQLPAVLQAAENKGIRVIAIVGSACSTSTGSFDDLKSLAAFAQKHQLWFHVDAAHGGALIFSKEYGQLLSGIQDADSITMDFHKMLLTPAITTALLYKDGKNAYHTFSQKAQYLWKDSDTQEWYNLAKRTFECTKTMMGFKVYAALNEFGTPLYESYINRVQDNAKNFAELINEAHDFELALEPQTNIVCFRYHPTDHQGDLCALNVKIREKLVENGPFYLVQTELNGKKWLRVTLSNPFTSILECSDLLNQIRSIPLS